VNLKVVDVLLVENNLSDSELTTLGIKQAYPKANVIHYADAAAALEFLQRPFTQSANLGLILIDIGLQKKADGFTVLKAVREHDATQFTPVVMLSGSEQEEKILEAYRLGANSYVIKPTLYENYLSRVTEVVRYWSLINIVPGEWNHHHNQNSALR
jgi:two-component system response regulator